RPVGTGQTAHHIVQRNSSWADLSEQVIQRSNPSWTRDSASNGATLWGTGTEQVNAPGHPGRGVSGNRPAGYHAGSDLHGARAQEHIYRVLSRAERMGLDPEAVLRQIGSRQETGRWKVPCK